MQAAADVVRVLLLLVVVKLLFICDIALVQHLGDLNNKLYVAAGARCPPRPAAVVA